VVRVHRRPRTDPPQRHPLRPRALIKSPRRRRSRGAKNEQIFALLLGCHLPDTGDVLGHDQTPYESSRTQLATVAEAASMLRCSRRTIFRLLSRGDIERVRIGRLVRIRVDDVAELIEGRR
jgi:excisionase family DNA binding protein